MKSGSRKFNVILVVNSIILYMTVLSLISVVKNAPTMRSIESDIIQISDFSVESDPQYAQISGESIHTVLGGAEKVFSVPVSLESGVEFQVEFSADCASNSAEGTLYVDLIANGYDNAENEFEYKLVPGNNQVSGLLPFGEEHPKDCKLRIFTLDDVEISISGLSVSRMEPFNGLRKTEIITMAVLLIVLILEVILLLPFIRKIREARGEQSKEKMSIKQKLLLILLPSLFLSVTFCIFGPLQLYLTNISEFWFSIRDIWWICVLCGVVVLAICIGIGCILPQSALEIFSCLLFGISLGLYIQGNFVTTNYGTLNGESVDWSSYGSVSITNTLMWAGCLLIPFIIRLFGKKMWKGAITYISVGIVAVQVITLGVLCVTTDYETAELENSCTLTKKGEFGLSDNENTLIFILDCYDSKVFSSFIENHPDLKETLWKDFTYYPNTVGGATRTIIALPYILTGQPYNKEVTYEDYLNESYQNTQLYDSLQECNYDVGIYTNERFVTGSMQDYFMNLSNSSKKVESYSILAKRLYRFTACRYFPHILKKSVWMYSGDFNAAAQVRESDENAPYIEDDALFYNELLEKGLTMGTGNNAFRLYHLRGLHGPYCLNSDSQSVAQASQEEQNLGVMNILNEYFKQMKEMGIYDKANIIVMSDHGEGGLEHNPLFLVKRGDSNTEFQISQAPMSYANLHPTLLSFLGKNTTGVKSLFELTDQDNKERLFYYQTGENAELYAAEYVIKGNAMESTGEETGRKIRIFSDPEGNAEYEFGTTLYFDYRNTAAPYIVEGFSKNEGDRTWTSGKKLVMNFPLEKIPHNDVVVSMEFVGRATDSQIVGAYINGQLLNYYNVNSNTLTFTIPKSMISEKNLELRFELPLAVTGLSGDSRTLALPMYSVTMNDTRKPVEETPKIAWSENPYIDFSESGNSAEFVVDGWHEQETEFRWTSERSTVVVSLKENVQQYISLTYFPYIASGVTEVYLEDNLIGTLDDVPEPHTVNIPISLEYATGGYHGLTFVTKNAVSPADTGESSDSRKLGIAVQNLQVCEITG